MADKAKFKKIEEERNARFLRQKKLEQEWLKNVIKQEEERRQRCQVSHYMIIYACFILFVVDFTAHGDARFLSFVCIQHLDNFGYCITKTIGNV